MAWSVRAIGATRDQQLLRNDTRKLGRRPKAVGRLVVGAGLQPTQLSSDFGLLRDLKCIIDLDAEIADCAFQPMSRGQ